MQNSHRHNNAPTLFDLDVKGIFFGPPLHEFICDILSLLFARMKLDFLSSPKAFSSLWPFVDCPPHAPRAGIRTPKYSSRARRFILSFKMASAEPWIRSA